MNCNDARERIEDLHDGELGGKEAAAVSSHLASCADCAAMMRQLEAESRLYRAYAEVLDHRSAHVADRWAAVQNRVAESASGRPRGVWGGRWFPRPPGFAFQLACALALVVVSVGVTLVVVRDGNVGPGGAGQPSQLQILEAEGGGTLAEAMRSIRHAEQEYVEAIRVLTGIVDRQKPALSGELVAEVERNLRQIDESIAATRKAYYEDPADPELAHYMLTAYSRKVELLQELASLRSAQPKT